MVSSRSWSDAGGNWSCSGRAPESVGVFITLLGVIGELLAMLAVRFLNLGTCRWREANRTRERLNKEQCFQQGIPPTSRKRSPAEMSEKDKMLVICDVSPGVI